MLSCKDINQYTDKYIDGELSIKQRLLVRFHLLMCVQCLKYVRQLADAINVFIVLSKSFIIKPHTLILQ